MVSNNARKKISGFKLLYSDFIYLTKYFVTRLTSLNKEQIHVLTAYYFEQKVQTNVEIHLFNSK